MSDWRKEKLEEFKKEKIEEGFKILEGEDVGPLYFVWDNWKEDWCGLYHWESEAETRIEELKWEEDDTGENPFFHEEKGPRWSITCENFTYSEEEPEDA